jgi:hypothetical protein
MKELRVAQAVAVWNTLKGYPFRTVHQTNALNAAKLTLAKVCDKVMKEYTEEDMQELVQHLEGEIL